MTPKPKATRITGVLSQSQASDNPLCTFTILREGAMFLHSLLTAYASLVGAVSAATVRLLGSQLEANFLWLLPDWETSHDAWLRHTHRSACCDE
jgi:hypothetical protein